MNGIKEGITNKEKGKEDENAEGEEEGYERRNAD